MEGEQARQMLDLFASLGVHAFDFFVGCQSPSTS